MKFFCKILSALGWVVFSVVIGIAVSISAHSTLAGMAIFLLAFFFTAGITYLEINETQSIGCATLSVFGLWWLMAVFSTIKLLLITVTLGWAITLGILLGVAWIVALVISFSK